LPPSFVATAKAANKSTHRRSRSSSLAGVTGYSAANCTQRGAATRAAQNMRLRRSVRLLSGLGVRGLWLARIKPSLLHRPRMAFISVLVLLRLALPLGRINEHVAALRARDSSAKQNEKSDQPTGELSSGRKKHVQDFHLRLLRRIDLFPQR
jgi:hypothetical protein